MADAAVADKPSDAPAPAPAEPAAPAAAAPAAPAAPAPAATPATPASNDKGYWPADWQKRFAGDDEKELKQVARYQSPEEIWKKARSLEKRLSSGEFKPAKPKDAKPEELAAWRKDSGIPESPDKYDLKFESGLVIGADDKPYTDKFLQAAHNLDMTPAQVKGALEWYFHDRESQVQQLAERDEQDRVKAIDTVAGEWGGKFSGYKNRIENFLSIFPESVRDQLKSARFPDGMAVFNHPDVLRTFVALSLKDIPDGVHVPPGGGDIGKGLTDRYQEIQKVMKENRRSYDKDEGLQKEMRSLIEALSKQGLIDSQGNLKKKAA